MTRLAALFLALLLPLQLGWNAAAAYCQHESAPKLSQHLGHHEHVHKDSAKKPVNGTIQIDSDCSFCNVAAPHAFTSETSAVPQIDPSSSQAGAPPSALRSAPPRAPDRPQWLRLA